MSWEYETELSCGRKIYGELFCYGNSFITDIFTGEYEVVEQPMFINLHYFSDDKNDPIDWMLPRKLNPEELAEAKQQSDASASQYLKYNSRLVAAVVAALCTVFTLTFDTWRSLSDSFAHGFLGCFMSLSTQGFGFRKGCGKCDTCVSMTSWSMVP